MSSAMSLYKRVPLWQQEVIEFAKEHGYSQTAYGNRRHATKELWSSDSRAVSRMGRQLVNATVQGTAADILKILRQQVRERDIVQRYSLRGVKPVYDEFTASVPLRLAKDYILEMTQLMRITPPGYPVHLEVDVEVGFSWGSQIELKDLSAEGIEKSLEELARGR
jgi:DNA polymerase-1